jgi:hypothetical protein
MLRVFPSLDGTLSPVPTCFARFIKYAPIYVQIFIGYLDNKCVALKLTKKEKEEKMPAENSIKTIEAIQKFYSKTPQKKPQQIIDVLYL